MPANPAAVAVRRVLLAVAGDLLHPLGTDDLDGHPAGAGSRADLADVGAVGGVGQQHLVDDEVGVAEGFEDGVAPVDRDEPVLGRDRRGRGGSAHSFIQHGRPPGFVTTRA